MPIANLIHEKKTGKIFAMCVNFDTTWPIVDDLSDVFFIVNPLIRIFFQGIPRALFVITDVIIPELKKTLVTKLVLRH
jgi:hypothetical protein